MLLALLMAATLTPRVVDVRLGPVQREIVRAIRQPGPNRFVDVEGALRSAKTWSILIALRTVVEDHPGIALAIARWTEGDLNQKLVPDWRNVCALMEIPFGTWNFKESCYDLPNGSRVYCVHLKTSQRDNRFATVRGLTVAMFYIDQLEEVPEDVYNEAALRLSQPGYPQLMVVSPNPVPETHWIAKKWPTTNSNPQHRYLRVAMRDNKHNLDPSTIEAAEQLYPIGHPLRSIKLEGRRGLDVSGTPVYSGAFVRARHVRESLNINPDLPLLECYDFGFHHPCVIWMQWAPWGHLRVLGGVMGSDLHLDAFLPIVERYRGLWFPQRLRLDATCDPAGASENSQGLPGTPVAYLRDWYFELGEKDADGKSVAPTVIPDANQPERRYAANQKAATYMRRLVNQHEAFLVDAQRWVLVELNDERHDTFFIDGLDVGYVFEAEPRHSSRLGSYYIPKKDKWFEHPMNCFEYGLQAFVLDLPLGNVHAEEVKIRQAEQRKRDERLALKRAQHDPERDERPRRLGVGARRGGYWRGRG